LQALFVGARLILGLGIAQRWPQQLILVTDSNRANLSADVTETGE
jgi:hypothetical protein